MEIKLYNTKTRTEEVFTPVRANEVRMYHCGPTVYNYAHIGNLRSYVFADILRRMFEWNGYTVTQVINITDVGHLVSDGDTGDDKMQKGATREGKTAWDIARFYEDAFKQDLHALNIRTEGTHFPRATDYIQEQIQLVHILEQKGYTYTTSDGIYFDTSKFKRYADFAKLDVQGLEAGARVAISDEKRNVTDFALWKFSDANGPKRDMEWPSPWGTGFPGWHIECSAMSEKLLGTPFDIHTGGIDHIPVHHTNEIAQSECAHEHAYVNYWMHNGFLNVHDGKMSKSTGDFLRLQTLIEKNISPLAYRYFLLTSHYRSALDFSFEALLGAQKAYTRLQELFRELPDGGQPHEAVLQKIREAVSNDLGTAQALAHLWEYIKSDDAGENKKETLRIASLHLGLGFELYVQEVIPESVVVLAEKRLLARHNKDWATSDALRAEIESSGFVIKDINEGYVLRAS